MSVEIIVAYNQFGLIGTNDNQIPWHIPEDMKHFKEITMGDVCVMGRKTWDSIPAKYRPLPGRVNAVLTRNPEAFIQKEFGDEGPPKDVCVFDHIVVCIDWLKVNHPGKTIFITGGGEIYREALESGLVDRIIASEVKDNDLQEGVFFHKIGDNWNRDVVHEYDRFDVVHYTPI